MKTDLSTCPNCGAPLAPGSPVCERCGTPVAAPGPAATIPLEEGSFSIEPISDLEPPETPRETVRIQPEAERAPEAAPETPAPEMEAHEPTAKKDRTAVILTAIIAVVLLCLCVCVVVAIAVAVGLVRAQQL